LFGERPSPGLLSFPAPGATLALDFANHGASTRALLAQLEAVVLHAGGRLYPAKDGLMAAETFQAGYPALPRFLPHIDPGFGSGFGRRVALVAGSRPAGREVSEARFAARTVAIFGATSDIAVAVARRYAEAGERLVLVGRDTAALAALEADLHVRGTPAIQVVQGDFSRLEDLPTLANAAWERFGGLDVALIAYGSMVADQTDVERDATATAAVLTVNLTSAAVLLNELARHFQAQGYGTIAAITSVAGDRGRKSNYVYGAAKGGLQRLLEGLRHRLASAGVAVVDIRPGLVATKMTAHLDRHGPLWATPDRVAADIIKAIGAGRAICYTPSFWRLIMFVVRTLPRFIFHRTSF
jgi:decaprenylphospho-beta-D-erythro-pentofuranosid-2-ulose 2-reductase